jgi:hypothetical protein
MIGMRLSGHLLLSVIAAAPPNPSGAAAAAAAPRCAAAVDPYDGVDAMSSPAPACTSTHPSGV